MRKRWLWAIPAVLGAGYVAGPNPATPQYKTGMPIVPDSMHALEVYINNKEAQHKIKPDNEARVVWWNDSVKTKTPYSIVYLHGYSASQAEGDPVHRTIAKKFGCNLFLSRLDGHGIDTTEPMANMTVDSYWESAKEALVIGKKLGNKVILMGTSTGASQALQLAGLYPNDVYALLLLSPNIEINNDKAYLLNNPWGLKVAQMVTGSDHNVAKDDRPVYKQYWHYRYPFSSTAELQEMLETSMVPETFKKVMQPVLLLYYYKDSLNQDNVVRVDKMLEMYDQLSTPAALKRKQAMPKTGDHVMASYIKSKDVEGVEKEIEKYIMEMLKIRPVDTTKKAM
jgi:pimeloyl-ACP methyl ester carboxylesterase